MAKKFHNSKSEYRRVSTSPRLTAQKVRLHTATKLSSKAITTLRGR